MPRSFRPDETRSALLTTRAMRCPGLGVAG